VPRAVLDTNVLVSALISPGGPSAALLLELRAGAFELVVSPMLPAELGDVLGRPKLRPYVTAPEATACVEFIGHEAMIHDDPLAALEPLSADPDDEYLLDLARAAATDVLVSGDSHLLVLRDIVPVMTPAEFLASLASR
jgi:putative PIN family toxin of toxin-antitoxin system